MIHERFRRAATKVATAIGTPIAFLVALGFVVLWAISGPIFHFSDTWQLVINTSTTVVTFLMVFIIQNTQNRDGRAVQAKLDAQSEVLRAIAERLGVDDDEQLLTRLVGEEEAPERVIADDQREVRHVAVDRSGREVPPTRTPRP